jgi:hypothetical protein
VSEIVSPLEIQPVLLINEKLRANTVPEVVKQIERFGQIDDVYSGQFSNTLVLQTNPTNAFTSLMTQLNSSGQFSSVYRANAESWTSVLPPGPYFLQGQSIHQAWRLYPDELDFSFSVIPEDVWAPAKYALARKETKAAVWEDANTFLFRYTVLDSLSDDGI